jgi:ADP-sugar diphosphatase
MLFRSAVPTISFNSARQLIKISTRHDLNTRIMSTFTLPDSSPECPVHLTSDLTKDQLLSFPAFKTWSKTLQHSLKQQESKNHTFHDTPYKLRSINIQSVDFFGGERIGFIKLKAEVSNDDGEKFPGSVFLRGGSVAMLVSLYNVRYERHSIR